MSFEVVVIGTSAGAVEALTHVLPPLPADFPAAIVVVVHLPADGKSLLAEIFGAKCRLRVKEAEDTEPLEGGTVYFAPPDYHVLIEQNNCLSLSADEPVHYSRPSIDVLFDSAADAYGEKLIGIVLTGANEDGAHGLGMICKAGGTVIVQDPDTAFAPAMPLAGLKACPSADSLSLDEISDRLRELVGGKA